jgi:hypothetical protein
MAEASGTFLVRASPALVDQFNLEGSGLTRASMVALFEAAQVPAAETKKALGKRSGAWPHDGIELRKDFIVITTNGSEWMKPLLQLVRHGQGLECYGRIDHEEGPFELYLMDGRGKRYFAKINYESDSAADVDRMANKWLDRVPAEVREKFPDLFVVERLGAAAIDEDPPQRWQPASDSDYFRETDIGQRYLFNDLLDPDHYERKHLERALELGVGPTCRWEASDVPSSHLHRVLASVQYSVAFKTRVANDMLDLWPFDLNQVCRGSTSVGTPLALAAASGLLAIVQRLLSMGADPKFGTEECALEAVRELMAVLPMTDSVDASYRADDASEGSGADYHAIVRLLESR